MPRRDFYRMATGHSVLAAKKPPVWLLPPLLLVGTLAVMVLIAGRDFPAIIPPLFNIAWAAIVLLSACLLGLAVIWPLRITVFRHSAWPDGYRLVLAIAVGLGLLSLATLLLAGLHWLHGAAPAVLLGVAAAAGYPAARDLVARLDKNIWRKPMRGEHWLLLLACVPAAVLLTAACFPAGSLWHTEGFGYDVLEYHLQLPKQFLIHNSAAPVRGNIYSYMPLNIEMLYLLLGAVARMAAPNAYLYVLVYGSQMLHALVTMLAAAAVALVPMKLSNRMRVLALLLVLATPWTIVIGSLAYNDGGVLLYGVLALGLAIHAAAANRGKMILLGGLTGLAVGCKMTAGVMVALPVAAMLLWQRRFRSLALVTVVALLVYSPWICRSMIATHTRTSLGNPIFPIFAGTLGMDHWTKSLAERFDRGHRPPAKLAGLAGHIKALLNQFLLDRQWSPGVAAYADALARRPGFPSIQTPWPDRLGLLWLVLLPALALAMPAGRTPWILLVCLAVQLLAWLTCTQLEARFLLPAIVPLAWLLGLAGDVFGSFAKIATAAVTIQTLFCALLLRPEAGLFLGRMRGLGPAPMGRIINLPSDWLLKKSSRKEFSSRDTYYLEGLATPLYIRGHVIYNTVFNRNRLARAIQRGGPPYAVRWLKKKNVNYLIVDWPEVARLRATYGFSPVITRANIAAMAAAGLKLIRTPTVRGIEIYRVPSLSAGRG